MKMGRLPLGRPALPAPNTLRGGFDTHYYPRRYSARALALAERPGHLGFIFAGWFVQAERL